MTTASEAHDAIETTLRGNVPMDGSGAAIVIRRYGEDLDPLPDTPAPFAVLVFDDERSTVIERGGGLGRLRHRNPGVATVYVFVPSSGGLKAATAIADQVTTLFRAASISGVIVESATTLEGGPGSNITPPGMGSAVGQYTWSGSEIEFRFDAIG